MARNPCGCVGTECSCKIISSDGTLIVAGKGTAAQPYDLTADQGHLAVVDTPTINFTKSGSGSTTNPHTISADATVSTMELTDVNHSVAPQTGQILAWDGTMYTPAPPVTAAPGAINHDTTLKGDGSTLTPLGVMLNPNGLLEATGNGVGLSQAAIAAINRAVRPIPPPVRIGRQRDQLADSFPSNYWVQILNYTAPSLPAGWYDISGSISGWLDGNYGERGVEGWTRITTASGGGAASVCNNWDTARPAGHDGQRTDYWPGISLDWGLKGTYHHTGGELRIAVDTFVETFNRNCWIMNQGTGVVLSCISLD